MSNQQLTTAAPAPPRSHDNLRRYGLPLLAVAALVAVILALIPPEKTLGAIIRPVFLHGALVQAGLIAFAPTFTAFANIVVAAAVWFLIKGAGLLRHPFDPIGGSNSFYYQVLYLSLLVAVLAFAALIARWRYQSTKR